MAYDNFQKEPNLPNKSKSQRASEDHLPRIFRTPSNTKFLNSTLDQMIQPGVVDKVNGYVGRKTAKAFSKDDIYLGDVSSQRENYQFEPASVITDDLGNVTFYRDYNDYMNSLGNYNRAVNDHSIVNEQEFYAYNPFIDWDKFSNFREYYWLPTGPQTISIAGVSTATESEYFISLSNNLDSYSYVITPNGQTPNPTIQLIRGVKYTFDINTPDFPIVFRSALTDSAEFDIDESVFVKYSEGDIQGVENGKITFELRTNAPDTIWYIAENDINVHGKIDVVDIAATEVIDVENEIVGIKNYTSGNGVKFSNGMKINFISPKDESYKNRDFYVEGVGNSITLVPVDSLDYDTAFTEDLPVEFDANPFDNLPFSRAIGYPSEKDYIVINRNSSNGNLWSKHNRWFHREVIELAAAANNQNLSIDKLAQASRPIIEFDGRLKLYNFGTLEKTAVDLLDDFTTDVFSTIEGSIGYNVDGVDLADGQRILFTNDKDPLVQNRIFKVKFFTYDGTVVDDANVSGQRQITLIEENDSISLDKQVVLIKNGSNYGGKSLHFKNNKWNTTQEKLTVNQSPLFDLFDEDDYSFSDTLAYPSSTFTGTKIFGYKVGDGIKDDQLGFALTYKNINNVGDIVFESNITTETFEYVLDENVLLKNTKDGYLRLYSDLDTFEYKTTWEKVENSSQFVIRQYVYDNTFTDIYVDQYDNSWSYVSDMNIIVYKNNKLLLQNKDWTVEEGVNNSIKIKFTEDLQKNDIILLKTKSTAVKNSNGYYEFPFALERNPSNDDLTEFTLGEINDHVSTIIENTTDFDGIYPGKNNLRDLGNVSKNGRRFLQHSAPMNLTTYHITDSNSNIINAIKFAKIEYSKFKREFLTQAESLGFLGDAKTHVDKILQKINQTKNNTNLFYFSDMLPIGGFVKTDHPIEDSDEIYFPLGTQFKLSDVSFRAVLVYLNETQLLHGKDYTFNDEGYVVVTASKQPQDTLTVYEYENTYGNCVPQTPTKLGLYPAYEPQIFTDTTYQEPTLVIQGHDGSIVKAYNDYRDDLLLELEKRIFNNLKVEYNPKEFNLLETKPSYYRSDSISRSSIDKSILADFFQWTKLVTVDYTKQTFNRDNRFTYNYRSSFDDKNIPLPGFWREIYKYYYDTDRPHTHPWEMLGESIEPKWWKDTYGAAPYTSDNLLMWEDIEQGIFRDPARRIEFRDEYKRPGLMNLLPVDEHGDLISPLEIGLVSNYASELIERPYVFGDGAPVETAWRRSSEFPFALLVAYALNKPCKLFATGFDRVNQIRNKTGNLIYKPTNKRIQLANIVFPKDLDDETDTYTSGVINYIAEYTKTNLASTYSNYKKSINSLSNRLGFKLAGYTDKAKLKLILDSRTPLNKGNVFVPDENYQIFKNESSPIELLNYSGLIVERLEEGFLVKGYSNNRSYFLTHPILPKTKQYTLNVGGVSENFVDWVSGNYYVTGLIVRNNSQFYRCKKENNDIEFSADNFSPLANLPITGGRNVIISQEFNTTQTLEVPYGTLYTSIQDVVDFILGYQAYLKNKGFVFDYFESSIGKVIDWVHSIQEFLFWTLYDLDEGSIISLSPASSIMQLASNKTVVSDIRKGPNGYTLLQADGTFLDLNNLEITRKNNDFITYVNPNLTGSGIYYAELPLTQTEHVVVLDNATVFNDIIYDQTPGYRQDRVKLLGYRTDEWSGSSNIPGFIYEDSTAKQWEPYVSYSVGSLIKYREFYYIAKDKVPGREFFEITDWHALDEKPRQGLLPNFEYKSNQFADFYDLDSDNLDIEQQRFAQHLIGYQKRNYLENIINNSVSQYKFYQGMILEKGTANSLTKLFDVLASSNKDSLEFYEEWAIRDGQYGGVDSFEEFETIIDESQIVANPQPILLTSDNAEEPDAIYRIKPFQVSITPKNYDNNPFPATYTTETFTPTPGFVHKEDVDTTVDALDDIVDSKVDTIAQGSFVWAGNQGSSWNVFKHVSADLSVSTLSADTITTDNLIKNISVGDIIGISRVYTVDINEDVVLADSSKQFTSIELQEEYNVFVKVLSVSNNKIIYDTPESLMDRAQTGEELSVNSCFISRFESARFTNVNDANNNMQNYYQPKTKIWVDNVGDNSNWKVLSNDNLFELEQIVKGPFTDDGFTYSETFASSFAVNDSNNVVCVADPNNNNGKVFVYRRVSKTNGWKLVQVIEPEEYADDNEKFASSIDISEDGQWLIVGSPSASNVKTNYKNDFVSTTSYNKNDIVLYKTRLWRAKFNLLSSTAGINFNTFDSVVQNIFDLGIENDSSADVPIITIGNYSVPFGTSILPFTDTVNHILVRAPKDLYANTKTETNDWQVKLDWNTLTYGNQNDLSPVITQPFNGNYSVLNEAFFDNVHHIRKSIDLVLYFDSLTVIPVIGETVQTDTGSGTVEYIKSNIDAKYVVYISNKTGNFNTTDSLFRPSGEFIGDFEKQLDTDGTVYGGFWWIDTPDYTPSYSSGTTDQGRGLVYVDMANDSTFENVYYNVLDYNTTVVDSENNKNSYIRILTSKGFPNKDGDFGTITDSRFVIRAPKALTDSLSPSDSIYLFVNQLPNYSSGLQKNLTDIGLTADITNKQWTVNDIWDGYVTIRFTKFQTNGKPYEPKIGQTIRDKRTGATGVVTFYQRDNLDATIFIDNKTGAWSKGEQFADLSEVEFLQIPGDPNPIYQTDREMGDIQNVSVGSTTNGALIVLDTETDIELPDYEILEGAEYFLYTNRQVLGEPISNEVPSILNANWEQVYNIPADLEGTASGLSNQGMVSIYKSTGTVFDLYGAFITQDAADNAYLGDTVEIRKNNESYTAFIKASGTESVSSPGKIYFYNKGIFDGIEYDWEASKYKNYKGPFDETLSYRIGDVVYAASTDRDQLYTARINIVANTPFSLDNWEVKEEYVDYVGFIPNNTNIVVINDSTSFSGVLDAEQMESFANDFDVSKKGDVLVAKVTYNAKSSSVVVYRNVQGNFQLSQTILTGDESSVTNEWKVAISNDGMFIAISKPLEDLYHFNEGQVLIYKQINGQFELFRTLNNSVFKSGEQFGYNIDFDGNKLLVAARNGDANTPTTFDTSETSFDAGFTNFSYVNEFQGMIYVYENVDDDYLLAQKVSASDRDLQGFGNSVLLKNSQLYVGIPVKPQNSISTDIGEFYNYKLENTQTTCWTKTRELQPTVDLNAIKEVYLYNTKTQEKIKDLDYIDINQGKIPGIVDAEINYKMSDDPAIYSVLSDVKSAWGKEHVGTVWWDLSQAKFLNPYQGDTIYSAQTWNNLFGSSTINVYEWIESDYSPEEYDNIAASQSREAFLLSISGESKSVDEYSTFRMYDSIAKTFTTKYYFWVKNKVTVPNNRKFSVSDIAKYIAQPANQGLEYITFISPNAFVLNNVNKYLSGDDIALNVQWYTEEDQRTNVHTQYKIISENLDTSQPTDETVRKWFDSLIGYDTNLLPVPDVNIPKKYRYGNLSKPRQSLFENRLEALKQFIERVNTTLAQKVIVDTRDISALFDEDAAPAPALNLYDVTVSDTDDLDTILIEKIKPAKLSPVVINGKIERVEITDIGRGYKVPPTVEIFGQGSDAKIELTIDSLGQVRTAKVINSGKNYSTDTIIKVRNFSALVNSDTALNGKWAIYDYNNQTWNRISKQKYNTTLYWEYIDWYATGFNSNTKIDHLIDISHDLFSANVQLNEIVKIQNIGTGGWLLLKRSSMSNDLDYTKDYTTIGRQNGTIKFKDSLYTPPSFGYDSNSFDIKFYDFLPVFELRIILNTIKDKIYIDDLLNEFNKLFFASLRYVLSEQKNVDWMFKTSFVKARHNVGELRQDKTFNNDNLADYEDYIREVKPYRTKIREYLSSYERTEPTNSFVTDFDLTQIYDTAENRLRNPSTTIVNNNIEIGQEFVENYPNKHWYDKNGYSIVAVHINDPGSKYRTPPIIKITNGGGEGAEIKAFIGTNGKLKTCEIINAGKGYTSEPTIELINNLEDGGTPANISIELGNGLVRSLKTEIKFDRTASAFNITQTDVEESFVASGSSREYQLQWPMIINRDNVKVYKNDIELLPSEFTYENILDISKTYKRYLGKITTIDAFDSSTNVKIKYSKSFDILNAVDRINAYYTPSTGQLGKDIAQLMNGVDYGGVQISGTGFDPIQGWDNDAWYTSEWDAYDNTNNDEVFTFDQSTVEIQLSQPLEQGTVYNVYLNEVRIDDPNYDGSTIVDNPNAIMQSLIGDGVTQTLYLDDFKLASYQQDGNNTGVVINHAAGDTLVIRKSSSDGTYNLNPNTIDTELSGGALAYGNAQGILAEDIIIDGDNFVTPLTSSSVEEHVPGQVLDTLNIKVYESPSGSNSNITTNFYYGNGVTTDFTIDAEILNKSQVVVKINDELQTLDEDFTIDVDNKIVTFASAPANRDIISINDFGLSGGNIIESDTFISDGSTINIVTSAVYEANMQAIVRTQTQSIDFVIVEQNGRAIISIGDPLPSGTEIYYVLARPNTNSNYSHITIEQIIADGSSTNYDIVDKPEVDRPLEWNTIVIADNKLLDPGYVQRFDINPSVRLYQLANSQIDLSNIPGYTLCVKIDGEVLTLNSDYTWIPETGILNISSLYDLTNKTKLEVYARHNADYTFGSYDINDSFVEDSAAINFATTYTENTEIKVITFSNHDFKGIDWYRVKVADRDNAVADTKDYEILSNIQRKRIVLDNPIIDAQYAWISRNGELLTPNGDYSISSSGRVIELETEVNTDDEFIVVHFAADPFRPAFGWQQFKDIRNKTHYESLDSSKSFTLSNDLNYYDKKIVLNDASNLSSPVLGEKPGVVWINGERIEYYTKAGNELSQLRRGTLGTGIKDIHPEGEYGIEITSANLVPYKDEFFTTVFTADGTSSNYVLDFANADINEFEVFVGGKRLRKNAINAYRFEYTDSEGNVVDSVAMDSPEGDFEIPADFTIANDSTASSTLILTTVPNENTKVVVVRKRGLTWSESGKSLAESNTDIATFLRSTTVDAPR